VDHDEIHLLIEYQRAQSRDVPRQLSQTPQLNPPVQASPDPSERHAQDLDSRGGKSIEGIPRLVGQHRKGAEATCTKGRVESQHLIVRAPERGVMDDRENADQRDAETIGARQAERLSSR
jgi:hypothetical protein